MSPAVAQLINSGALLNLYFGLAYPKWKVIKQITNISYTNKGVGHPIELFFKNELENGTYGSLTFLHIIFFLFSLQQNCG